MTAKFDVNAVELLDSRSVVVASYPWGASVFSHSSRETDGLHNFASGYRPFVSRQVFHGFYIGEFN